ncbi:MAG: hypothetical protein FRX49_00466 [Trebouxia sp. A1-2]|nr:MAG: hypothetical protein FRX49_00466 [Trebouxia sp. A1-2]
MLGLENWRDQLRLADRGQGAGSANSGLRVSGLNPAPAGTVNTNAGGNTGTEGNAGAGGSANGSAGAGTGGGAGPVFRDDAMLNCGQVVELITKSFQLAAVVKDMKVKVSPPEKWTGDEKGRDVNFFLDEVTAFNERTVLPQVFWAEVQVVRELDGTPYHPGGSVFDDFRNGLKPDVRKFVDDHASTGWCTNIKDLYQKALEYEINGLASGRDRDISPVRGNGSKGKGKRPREAEQGGGNTNKRLDGGRHQRGGGGHNRNGGVASGVHIPNDEFEARKRAGLLRKYRKDSMLFAEAGQGSGQRALGPSPWDYEVYYDPPCEGPAALCEMSLNAYLNGLSDKGRAAARVGRPDGAAAQNSSQDANVVSDSASTDMAAAATQQPGRRRGRPRRTDKQTGRASKKRGRGRPRKQS